MNEHQSLLEEVRRFCDPATGEVVELIPEDLMRQLRAAKMAVGIPGEVSQTTASAKWFVFLDEAIREQISARWRAANRKRQHAKRRQAHACAPSPLSDVQSPAKTVTDRGLRGFLRQRKPDQ